MPNVVPEFGQKILELKGSDSFGKATVKTKISKAYLIMMSNGVVPSEEKLHQFCDVYAPDDKTREELFSLAGLHIEPKDTVVRVEYALRTASELSDYSKQTVLNFLKEVIEREKKDNCNE